MNEWVPNKQRCILQNLLVSVLEDNRVFPLTRLDDVITKVEQHETVLYLSCNRDTPVDCYDIAHSIASSIIL